MDRIYKYKMIDSKMEIPAKVFLDVQIQEGEIVFWVIDNPRDNRIWEVFAVGTGREVDLTHAVYIGTVQVGKLVWHLFTKLKS